MLVEDITPNKCYKLTDYPHWDYFVFIPTTKYQTLTPCYISCKCQSFKKIYLKEKVYIPNKTNVEETDLSEFDWAEEFKLFCL